MSDIGSLTPLWKLSSPQLISDSRSSLVYRARQEDIFVIVKILKPEGKGEIPGMDFLRWRDGKAAARVLAQQDDAFLLEDGGDQTLLSRYKASGDPGTVFEFQSVIVELHALSDAPSPASLVPLESHFTALFEQAAHRQADDHATLFTWAADLARRLLSEQIHIRPLHGDIHHGNIVSVFGTSWKAIDPQGLIGDPAYDYANIFGNPGLEPDKVLDPDRCIFLAETFTHSIHDHECTGGLNALKLLRYAAVHSALSASWSLQHPDLPQDIDNAAQRLALAEILKGLIEDRHNR